MQQDLATVRRVRVALDEAGQLQPVHQLDGGVMAQRQTIRQIADGRTGPDRQPLERQQSLMLLGLNAVFPRLDFAELEEMAELVSKFGQLLIFTQSYIH
jgi:hypothetical protein